MGWNRWVVAFAMSVVLGACAAPGGDAGEAVGEPAVTSPEPSPSYACPIVEGQEVPEGCIPYDPQLLMDSNERYRDHMGISAEAFAPAQAAKEQLAPMLEDLRASGTYSHDSVLEAVESVGLTGAAVSNGPAIVYFDAPGPSGGCVFGYVNEQQVEVNVAGPIMDGGCVAAVGH